MESRIIRPGWGKGDYCEFSLESIQKEGVGGEMRDNPGPLRYIAPMPAKVSANGYRPIIRPKNLRTSVPKKQIRDAVRRVMDMKKNDPVAYAARLKKHENTVIRLVPG